MLLDLRMRLAISALFLVGFLLGSAGADRKVDWSQYLEKPGERTPRKETPVVAKQDKKAAKSSKKAKATRSAQRPAKAAAKRKGRRR